MIPAEVVAEDRRLDLTARQSQEELAHLRWHWTLDETNAERVPFTAYAAAVGRAESKIRGMAHAYAAHLATPDLGGEPDIGRLDLGDRIEMQKTSAVKAKAAQLIADNNGIRVANVLSNKRAEVASLVDMAQQAAARRGTTVDAELERAAITRRKAADVRVKQAVQKKAEKDLRYIEIEGDVAAAMRHMNHVLDLARTVALSDDHLALIHDSLAKLKALLNLIDLQIVGTVDIDWDAEMAKIGDIA